MSTTIVNTPQVLLTFHHQLDVGVHTGSIQAQLSILVLLKVYWQACELCFKWNAFKDDEYESTCNHGLCHRSKKE